VAAVADPDPRVSGRGLAALRNAGTTVEVGLLENEARALNEAYFHHRLTGRPFVILKAAMSLDGKIATHTGDSKWISGAKSRRFVHQLRARCGAVLCGINTVLVDDPLLTSRIRGAPRQPLRIVLDTHLRLSSGSQIARTAHSVPTLVVTGENIDQDKRRNMEQEHIEILQLSADNQNRMPLAPLLDELGRRGITSLLVEGGAETHASFLSGQFAKRLLWIIAPKIIGGRDAPGPVGGEGSRAMSETASTGSFRIRRLAEDLLVEATPDYGASGSK
jgi:diaminohydroxyphosphoribosylaminopyrimidine deaminase/5-amino-6-(5-phosphoribosylamino)uracil reductase